MDGQADPWSQLEQELDAWRRERRQATLWWRDDDATGYTPQLARLCDIAATHCIPLCIAVVPRDLDGGLKAVMTQGNVALQHGWAHANHAPPGERAAELGHHREMAQILSELERGHARLSDTFGSDFLPALVPPWNRIGDRVVNELHRLGLMGLSTFMPRQAQTTVNGLRVANCHVDPINWRHAASTRPLHEVLERFCEHLTQRRSGLVDSAEPTGLLTHHLQHDEELWRLLPPLLERLCAYGNTLRWLPGAEVFARD